jgi:hypothetical protein
MTIITRPFLCGVILVAALSMTAASAPIALRKSVMDSKPMMFGVGIRARDRRVSTPPYAALIPGVYAREILQTASAHGDYMVRVWAMLVSPHVTTGETKLPGAAVLAVNAGRVELIMGDQKIQLEPGATAAVPEGASLRFVNSDENRPAQLRAVLISGSR